MPTSANGTAWNTPKSFTTSAPTSACSVSLNRMQYPFSGSHLCEQCPRSGPAAVVRIKILARNTGRDLSKFRIELFGFLAAYTGVLFSVSPRLSLWLDEIRDLIGVRRWVATVLEYTARRTAAGVPLGYAVQFLFGRMFGFSTFTGRLSAALFSVAACLGLAALSRRLKLQHPLLPLLIFASFPLQLRYALEARPYSQALCLSIWCTVAFFSLVDRPGISRASLYALSIAAGLYTQPYSVFVPVAHLCWIVLAGKVVERRRVLMLAVWLQPSPHSRFCLG